MQLKPGLVALAQNGDMDVNVDVSNNNNESTSATAMPAAELRTGASREQVIEYMHEQLDSLRGAAVLGGLLLAKGRASNSRLEGGTSLTPQTKYLKTVSRAVLALDFEDL